MNGPLPNYGTGVSAIEQDNPTVPEDVMLMQDIASGNKNAMANFVSNHLVPLVNFAMRYLGRKQDAEDVAQEAFMRVWQKASSWESRNIPPRNWLYKITYNLCIDEIRKRKLTISDQDNVELIADEQPEIDLQRSEKLNNVDRALHSLPERQRTAITLFAYQGFSNIDTAKIMDISVEALESLLSRGRRKLRKEILEKP